MLKSDALSKLNHKLELAQFANSTATMNYRISSNRSYTELAEYYEGKVDAYIESISILESIDNNE